MRPTPLNFALFSVMLTYVILTVVYCLGALHNERSDRSILFWKSLPVSDVTTVIAKASIPILILPLITFVVLVVTQGIMLIAARRLPARRRRGRRRRFCRCGRECSITC